MPVRPRPLQQVDDGHLTIVAVVQGVVINVQLDVGLHDRRLHFLGVVGNVAPHLIGMLMGEFHTRTQRRIDLAYPLGAQVSARGGAALWPEITRLSG